jgi:hypothetical protein
MISSRIIASTSLHPNHIAVSAVFSVPEKQSEEVGRPIHSSDFHWSLLRYQDAKSTPDRPHWFSLFLWPYTAINVSHRMLTHGPQSWSRVDLSHKADAAKSTRAPLGDTTVLAVLRSGYQSLDYSNGAYNIYDLGADGSYCHYDSLKDGDWRNIICIVPCRIPKVHVLLMTILPQLGLCISLGTPCKYHRYLLAHTQPLHNGGPM